MEEAYTEDDLRKILRNQIKEMKEEGKTQADLAELIGVHPTAFSQEMSGARGLSGKTLRHLGFKRTILFRKIKRK